MKRISFLILGIFLFFMGLHIYNMLNTFTKSGDPIFEGIGLLLSPSFNADMQHGQIDVAQVKNDISKSTANMVNEYFSLLLSLPSAISLMLFGAISIITGVFGRDFWKAVLDFFLPTP